MNCYILKKKLYLYLKDELPAGETREIEKHLEDCPDCSDFKSQAEVFLSTTGHYIHKDSEEHRFMPDEMPLVPEKSIRTHASHFTFGLAASAVISAVLLLVLIIIPEKSTTVSEQTALSEITRTEEKTAKIPKKRLIIAKKSQKLQKTLKKKAEKSEIGEKFAAIMQARRNSEPPSRIIRYTDNPNLKIIYYLKN